MTDQTPDPWEGVKRDYVEINGVPVGHAYYLADAVDRALAAERAQTARVEELNRNALHAQRERAIAAEHELAQRDETIRQQAEQIATLTQERDEAIRRAEKWQAAESAVADGLMSAEARCATLTAALEGLRVKHRECEDCWYSCPKSAEGCCNEAQGDACNCGADEQNAKIDAALDAAAPQGEGASR